MGGARRQYAGAEEAERAGCAGRAARTAGGVKGTEAVNELNASVPFKSVPFKSLFKSQKGRLSAPLVIQQSRIESFNAVGEHVIYNRFQLVIRAGKAHAFGWHDVVVAIDGIHVQRFHAFLSTR